MKTLTKFVLFFSLVFFSNILAQTQSHYYVYNSDIEYNIDLYYNEQNYISYYEQGFYGYNYGLTQNSINGTNPILYEKRYFRTFYQFDLTVIPDDAYNIAVYLEAYRSSGSGNSKIVTVPDNQNYLYLESCFQSIGQGNLYFNTDNNSGTLHNVTSAILPKLDQGYINIGAKEENWQPYVYGYITIHWHVYYDLPINITADNNFIGSSGTNHGVIKVDGVNKTVPLTGYTFTKTIGQSTSLTAISPQTDNQNYQVIWHTGTTNRSRWERNSVFAGNDQTKTFTVTSGDNGAIFKAYLRKYLNNVVFQNNFIGVGNGGVIKVNGIQYNSPKIADPVVELNSVTGAAVTQSINGIQYTFDHWNDGSTTSSKTYNPATNTTYTAYYTGKPLSYTVMNTHFNDVPGQNVIIYWNDHPNTNVTQYKIWRKVKHNGVMSDPYLIATKNRGITSYTDYDYVITNGYTDDLLYYDVRPYYSTENVYADPYYLPIFAELIPKTADSTAKGKNLPQEFSISCFPNPFNPSTNIRVTMPSDGLLQVVIYNVLGEEILQLKNEMVTKGNYNFIWNGKDSGFNQVNSGIYIALVKTEVKMLSQKIVLLK